MPGQAGLDRIAPPAPPAPHLPLSPPRGAHVRMQERRVVDIHKPRNRVSGLPNLPICVCAADALTLGGYMTPTYFIVTLSFDLRPSSGEQVQSISLRLESMSQWQLRHITAQHNAAQHSTTEHRQKLHRPARRSRSTYPFQLSYELRVRFPVTSTAQSQQCDQSGVSLSRTRPWPLNAGGSRKGPVQVPCSWGPIRQASRSLERFVHGNRQALIRSGCRMPATPDNSALPLRDSCILPGWEAHNGTGQERSTTSVPGRSGEWEPETATPLVRPPPDVRSDPPRPDMDSDFFVAHHCSLTTAQALLHTPGTDVGWDAQTNQGENTSPCPPS
ncbi:hypothetical protein CPLU01_06435 [Colletotrichum plurivorum]|uniref:Uncharacterized protein n=1 Tax=Colletotrichum plurivorum TaxID=2175906 RepID=A0A8H6NGF4_9PEZI|nr:hypothetical protein CPLU01_06435 [Colletotrichum plurivorum]